MKLTNDGPDARLNLNTEIRSCVAQVKYEYFVYAQINSCVHC